MKANSEMGTVWVVIQQGGTDGEHYSHEFDDRKGAMRFMRSAEHASYLCFGPFAVVPTGHQEVIAEALKVMMWLEKRGLQTSREVKGLKRALERYAVRP